MAVDLGAAAGRDFTHMKGVLGERVTLAMMKICVNGLMICHP